jgi:hypothetical protein
MKPISVTFDTCSLDTVIWPETSQHKDGKVNGLKVREAIENGRVHGFFSESLITLEGIQRYERSEVLGSTRLETQFASPDDRTINITIAVKQDRNPLPQKFRERIQVARSIGMRALKGPARIGWISVQDGDGTLFKSYGSVLELADHIERAHQLATAIAARGVGHPAAVSLGLQFLARANFAQPELWFRGLQYAQNKRERAQINLAINEWADGDSVASHYGHCNDVFCTEDRGRGRSHSSVLDDTNKAWLQNEYGIKFVNLAQLAVMLEAPHDRA